VTQPGKEFLKKVHDQIYNAEKYHEEFFKAQALRSMRLLRGDISFVPEKLKKDSVNPNLIFSTVRNYLPNLYYKNPDIYIRPRTFSFGKNERDAVISATLCESMMKYYQDSLKMKNTDKLTIQGSLVEGVGYAYDWWIAEGSENYVSKDEPLHKFVNGINIFVDPTALEFEDAAFVVRKFGMYPSLAKKRGFKDIDKVVGLSDDSQYLRRDETGRVELPIFYEVWSKEYEKMMVVSTEGGMCQQHKEIDFNIEMGYPFTPLILNPSTDRYYPMSLVEVLESLQKFQTLMMTFGVAFVKRAIPKIVAMKGTLSRKNMQALTNDDILAVLEVGNDSKGDEVKNVQHLIQPVLQANLPAEFMGLLAMNENIFNTLSGISREKQGGYTAGDKTATEASILESFLRARMDDYRDIVRDFIKESREKLLRQIRMNATGDKWLRLNRDDVLVKMIEENPTSGFGGKMVPKGQYAFLKWDKDDILEQYDIEVGVGSTMPFSREYQTKEAMQFYAMMGNDPLLDQTQVRKYFLDKIGIKNVEQWMAKPKPPVPVEPEPKISVSIKFEELDESVQQQILAKAKLVSMPVPMPKSGSAEGGFSPLAPRTPLNAAQINESGVPGMQLPPSVPEL
jgi:hypothetical protein